MHTIHERCLLQCNKVGEKSFFVKKTVKRNAPMSALRRQNEGHIRTYCRVKCGSQRPIYTCTNAWRKEAICKFKSAYMEKPYAICEFWSIHMKAIWELIIFGVWRFFRSCLILWVILKKRLFKKCTWSDIKEIDIFGNCRTPWYL